MSSTILQRYLQIVQQLNGYEPRPVQEIMVEAVDEAMKSGLTSVIEAGTGSGKSFGYLIPVLSGSNHPVVISTGTIALQEQLMEKDIPFVAKAAGLDNLDVRLVKGRRNYLCYQKLQEFEKSITDAAPERLYITILKSALNEGWNGDKALLDFEIPSEIWEEVQSDSEDCLSNRCAYYNESPYRLAREKLDEADVLVVNHALYCQDLIAGQSLLPPHELIVFDEAHQLKSFAIKAFTARIGKFATHKLLRKIHRRLQAVPDEYQHALYQIEAEILQWLFRFGKQTFKIVPDRLFLKLIEQQLIVLNDLRSWLACCEVSQISLLDSSQQEQETLQVQRGKLLTQMDNLAGRWELFTTDTDPDRVNWAEVTPERLYYEIKSTPLNIAEHLNEHLWSEKNAILTSATLAINNDLRCFRKELGLPLSPSEIALDRILESPFDFNNQCQLYLPPDMPDPNDDLFQAAIADEIPKILNYTRGRAFILFTSNNAMHKVSAAVIPKITFPAKVQGDLPKNRLIEWFKETPNSVLFATASFWEGIDIPGESLSCVIIDRIPFATPDEPVNSAMVERLKQRGEDWFNGYVLPEAAIRLKQGFGRLIRSRQDCGIVAILDPRLKRKGYGKKILASLPKTNIVTSLDALVGLAEKSQK